MSPRFIDLWFVIAFFLDRHWKSTTHNTHLITDNSVFISTEFSFVKLSERNEAVLFFSSIKSTKK
jgi:hypothetical protein